MLSIPKSKVAAALDPSSEIPADITCKVYEDEEKVTVFHAHKYYLALISKVLKKRIFVSMRGNSDSEVLDIRGTTAQAFATLINFLYYKECEMEQKTLSEMIEVADLAEMYEVKGLMQAVESTLAQLPLDLENVVEFADTVEKLAVLRSFQNPRALIRRCCSFLRKTLRTRVIDFSGLKFSPEQVSTVEMLHEGIMQLPLSVVCKGCKKFVIDVNHNCTLRRRYYPRLYH